MSEPNISSAPTKVCSRAEDWKPRKVLASLLASGQRSEGSKMSAGSGKHSNTSLGIGQSALGACVCLAGGVFVILEQLAFRLFCCHIWVEGVSCIGFARVCGCCCGEIVVGAEDFQIFGP